MGKEFDRMVAIDQVVDKHTEVITRKLLEVTNEAIDEWQTGEIPYDEMASVIARCNVIILDIHNLMESMKAEKYSIDSDKLELLKKSTESTGFWGGLEKEKGE